MAWKIARRRSRGKGCGPRRRREILRNCREERVEPPVDFVMTVLVVVCWVWLRRRRLSEGDLVKNWWSRREGLYEAR